MIQGRERERGGREKAAFRLQLRSNSWQRSEEGWKIGKEETPTVMKL